MLGRLMFSRFFQSRLLGGGLRFLLTSLKQCFLSGGVRDGDCDRLWRMSNKHVDMVDLTFVMETVACWLVGGKGERERELLLGDEEGRGNLCP